MNANSAIMSAPPPILQEAARFFIIWKTMHNHAGIYFSIPLWSFPFLSLSYTRVPWNHYPPATRTQTQGHLFPSSTSTSNDTFPERPVAFCDCFDCMAGRPAGPFTLAATHSPCLLAHFVKISKRRPVPRLYAL